MKLYQNPLSPNCVMVRTVANLLDLPLEIAYVNLMAGEQNAPEYLQLNPNGKVPTLVDGDKSVWETTAVMQYIASKKPSALWPADEDKRLEINKWMSWSQCHFIRAIGTFTFENLFKKMRGAGAPNADALKTATEDFHRFAKVLDAQLAKHKYITGNELTLADIMAAGYLIIYGQKADVPFAAYKNIQRLVDDVAALPAWQSAAEDTHATWQKAA